MRLKHITMLMTALMMLAFAPLEAHASIYPGYLYSYEKEAAPAPLPYWPEDIIRAEDMGLAPFSSPEDLYIGNGTAYVADTGNNRIVVFDMEERSAAVLDSFRHDGKEDGFLRPEGLFVDEDNGHLYIADTGNGRVVHLTEDGRFVKTIEAPHSSFIRGSFQFSPSKVALDKAKRLYVISKNAYEGIMEFDADGGFNGFIGTNRVRFNPVDLLWKRLSTSEQRDKMVQFVPLEFNNMNIDSEGFLYTTTPEINSEAPIKRLNPSGIDILRREGSFPPKGDIHYLEIGSVPGSSIFVAVQSDEAGIYHGLDFKRGRIFTYDKDGQMLHQFGGIGNQEGRFRSPAALGKWEETLYVLDKGLGQITAFSPTPYGSAIRKATIAQYNGEAALAKQQWQEVLRLNRNNEIAYVGIGKALLKEGDNAGAMRSFELGSNRAYYSEAFKRYREEWIERNFGYLAGGFLLLLLAPAIWKRWKRRRGAGGLYTESGIWSNPLYTMTHPIKGFWEMKFEGKGRLGIAVGIVLLLGLTMILKYQYSGFVVNNNNPDELNSLAQLRLVLLPVALWAIANWSLTTLMDGEGKFREIILATGYSLLPFIVIYLPQILLSRIITQEESTFYYLLDSIAFIWFLILLFTGTMTVHQYTPGKTAVTMLLTVVVIGILLFLALLVFSILQQMLSFFSAIYTEVIFRL
ncbi:YIP1 family protein [Paenibacillus sp. J5C_2022]|uniref:YIP1 family protein n=1 Tax=Paenibacillus sp. J5C2022 TaxID=2977129 RepID=UPI0021D1B104|nr:YIP1 family protein [Paenibacillus sp. J5C2022]MCU6712342.1 YIP1 family protein [Paenibacillus sp. J5C2022]